MVLKIHKPHWERYLDGGIYLLRNVHSIVLVGGGTILFTHQLFYIMYINFGKKYLTRRSNDENSSVINLK